VDRLKGVAMVWVVLNHIVEQLAGGNFAGAPTGTWPPLHDRIAQFRVPVSGAGPFDWPLTAPRDAGWLADQAVTIFIVLSGFGLALGLIASQAAALLDARVFYVARLKRIYPFWWGAHVLFLPTGLLLASGLSTGDWQYYASLIGLRFIPAAYAYGSSSWWYVGVILQLYLAFPLLWWIMRTRGPLALLAGTWSIGFLSLAVGHAVFHGDVVEMWQRGIFAITRLPEFAFGMVLALWWARDPSRGNATMRRPAVRVAAAVTYAAGFLCSFTLTGMIVAPTMLGIGAIVLLYPLVAWRATGRGALEFVGRHSFTIYLTHQFIIAMLVRPELTPLEIAAAILLALLGTAAATYVLEYGTTAVETALDRLKARRGRTFARLALGGGALAVIGLPLAAELLLRSFAPQDLSRPRERIALEADPAFGWRFIPSRTIVLPGRVAYRLTSNADGFPGPDLAPQESKVALRVLVVGDGISSAGVDTEVSWPQLLRHELTRMHRRADVADFAVSGYGPNQEAPVARSYTRRYRPAVVLVQVYPDDVRNVLTDTPALRREIGLDRPPADDPQSVLALERLRGVLPAHLIKPLGDWRHHRPPGDGYRLGAFAYLERGHAAWDGPAVRASTERYRDIARAARTVGARTILVFVPAPAQVCDRDTLAYYPQGVTLADTSLYDIDLPNRRAAQIAAAARLTLWDLTPALRSGAACPYARFDPYLRPEAHRTIAAVIARRLLTIAASRPALQAGNRSSMSPQVAAR